MTTKPEKVCAFVKSQIAEGAFVLGDAVSVSCVMTAYRSTGNSEMRVSRGTAYAALKLLEAEGIVEASGEHGAFTVRRAGAVNSDDAAAVAAYLSAYVFHTKGGRVDDGLTERLTRMTRAMRLAFAGLAGGPDDGAFDDLTDAFQRYDAAFHGELIRAASSPALEAIGRYAEGLAASSPPRKIDDLSRHLAAHERLIDALNDGDPDGFKAYWEGHWSNGGADGRREEKKGAEAPSG